MSDEPTIDFDRRVIRKIDASHADTMPVVVAPDLSNTKVSVRSASDAQHSRLGRRFEEATQELLRQRLLQAAVTLAGMILLVLLLVLLFSKASLFQTIVRSISLVLTLAVLAALSWMPRASLFKLRMLEIALFSVPMFEACVAQVFETQRLLEEGKLNEVANLHWTIGAAVSVFIALYGVFIPAKWVRTALVTGISAIVPTSVAAFQVNRNPELADLGIPSMAMAALLFMMATVATLGARLVNITRKEAVSARRYGQYQLTRELGRGGMGIVYRAEHQLLKRPAAIKLIRAESAFSKGAIDRFEQEVQLSATLSHWNTVQIYDYGRTSDGDFYYVMEYLDGETLQQRIKSSGPLDPAETVLLVKQIGEGLAEAHCRGMVHRDLKPANIFLANVGGHEDVVKILDFGLATEASRPAGDANRKSICGSPPYMSPEQISGLGIDHRSDIYSIGCVIFECLTGKQLVEGNDISEVLEKHLRGIEQVPDFGDELKPFRQLIRKCISKLPENRYSSVHELIEAVAAIKFGDHP